MSDFVLLLIVLVEGFVTISAEILTMRQIAPVAGNSVVVTSLIIGVFLLFLAYGYRRGGEYQKNYMTILKRNFTKSAIWLGIGLSFAVIDLFFYYFQRYISSEILAALMAYLLLVTAPLVYILGQTVPITMELIKKAKTVGEVGGKILHLSTIGSFLGAVLTSLLLMNYLGVAWTIVINYLLLMLLAFVLFRDKKKDFVRGLVLCGVFVFVFVLNITLGNHMFVKTNAYTNYRVINQDNNKILALNNSLSSMVTREKKGFPYIEFIKRVMFQDLALTNKNILVLGAGGFTLSAEGSHGNRFVYVDIDKDMYSVVRNHVVYPVHGEFVAKDARDFLNSNHEKFDVIISDVYSHERSIPAHLLTQEYFIQIKQNLQPHGEAFFNIIGHPTLEDVFSKTMDNTIRSVFTNCMVIPLQYSNQMTNIIYVCRNSGDDPKKWFQLD